MEETQSIEQIKPKKGYEDIERFKKEKHYIDSNLLECLVSVRPIRNGINTGRINIPKRYVGKVARIYIVILPDDPQVNSVNSEQEKTN